MVYYKKGYFYLLLILLIGLLLRTYNLNHLPVFADESIYVRWAQIIKNEPTLRFIPLSDGKPPLYMWIVWPVLSFFSNPLVAARSVSVFAGLGTILGIFIASNLLFKNRNVSLLASLIYALAPLAVFFDRMALADSMLSMFGIWTFIFGFLTIKTARLDYAMLTGFALGAALLTKSPAIFFAVLLPTLLLLSPKLDLKSLAKLGRLFIPTYIIAFGIFNIMRLGPNFHLLSSRNYDYVYPYSNILQSPLNPFLSHLSSILNFFLIWGPVWVLVLLVIGKLTSYRTKLKELLVLGAWVAGPVLVSAEFSKTMTARYILFVLPFVALIAGLAIGSVKKGIYAKLGILFTALFILQSLFTDYRLATAVDRAPMPRSERSGYLEEWTAGVGIESISNKIKALASENPGKQIVVGAEGYFGTPFSALEFYLQEVPNVIVIGVGINLVEIPSSLVDSNKAGNKTYLVVNSSRLFADYIDLDLDLVEEYPKAVKPDGTRESLYFFELRQPK